MISLLTVRPFAQISQKQIILLIPLNACIIKYIISKSRRVVLGLSQVMVEGQLMIGVKMVSYHPPWVDGQISTAGGGLVTVLQAVVPHSVTTNSVWAQRLKVERV